MKAVLPMQLKSEQFIQITVLYYSWNRNTAVFLYDLAYSQVMGNENGLLT